MILLQAWEKTMKLSRQAIRAIMMALQNSLMEQSDIVPVLEGFDFVRSDETKRWGSKGGELDVNNSPVVVVKRPDETPKFDLK